MKKLPQISDAEFEVMNVIWKYAPINTNDIVDRLSKESDWSPRTIQTMLSRLEKKGALYHEKEGRIFVYSPAVPKESYLQKERGTCLHRFFDGALNQMMVSFLNDNDLSDSDLDELQAILNEKREKKRR